MTEPIVKGTLTKVTAYIGSRKEADFNVELKDVTDKEEAAKEVAKIVGVDRNAVDIRAMEVWDQEFLGTLV